MAGLNGSAASLADFIWKNAEDLWGDFKHTDFGKVILPFTLLRRLECVLEPTRDDVRAACKTYKDSDIDLDLILRQTTRYPFYNTSQYALGSLGGTKTRQNLQDYVAKFSDNARVIFEQFDFTNTVLRLDKAGLLFKICSNFAGIELHPDAVPDRVMSNVYEHLIRRFGAEVNEAAEDFMTPRDVVHLAITLLLDPDDELFEDNPGLIRTIYDPTCGTGGFLSDGMDHVAELGSKFKVPPVLIPYGQELEPETHAVCLTSMLLRTLESDPGRDLSKNIKLGSTLSNDQLADERFHYGIANPPFGKKWEKDQPAVTAEHKEKGMDGRFGPGLPRINDGSMLFLLHLASKLEAKENGGGRAAIVLSGSPLFNGAAGSGESEIRRWLLENDLVDAIVALPTELFFRTGIGAYLWILSNKKPPNRRGKVQLINAANLWSPIKNEGNKRRVVGEDQRRQIVEAYASAEDSDISRMHDYRTFGYRRVRILRPLRMTLRITEDAIPNLLADKAWQKLQPAQQKAWMKALTPHIGSAKPYAWAEAFVIETAATDAKLGKTSRSLAKLFVNAFGVRDPAGEPVLDASGQVVPDANLTDYENVPLLENVMEYFDREVASHVPDAFLDETVRDDADNNIGRVGYEINFPRYFYKYSQRRTLSDVDTALKGVAQDISALLSEINSQEFGSKAATTGLDPTAPMIESGIEWIGRIPRHWTVAPLKYVARLESGHTPSRSVPAYWENCTIPWFTLADIWQVRKEGRKIITDTSEKVSELGLANSSARRLPPGTVVLSRTASVGFPAILGCEMATSQDFAAWICGDRIYNEYLYYCLIAMRPEFDRLMIGSTHKTIYMPDIEGFRCPLPPLDEQRQIVNFLNARHESLDRLSEAIQQSNDLLKERRSTFVTAAITGHLLKRNRK